MPRQIEPQSKSEARRIEAQCSDNGLFVFKKAEMDELIMRANKLADTSVDATAIIEWIALKERFHLT